MRRDLHRYHRTLKLLHHFGYATDSAPDPFRSSSGWEPHDDTLSEPIQGLIVEDGRGLERLSMAKESDNLSGPQRRALNQLKQNQDIVIKPADKGSKIVILDRTQYLLEAQRQLNNTLHYQPLSHTLQQETQRKIRELVTKLYEEKYITAKQRNYLFGPDTPRPRKFYLLPKIHKDPETWPVPYQIPSGRPIVSDCGSESYAVSEYIDHYLNPLSQRHPSYIKDTYEFINKIKMMRIPPGSVLFSVDIDSLYTNINTQLGLKTVRETFNKHPDQNRPDDLILQLLELSLTKNDFEFDNKVYLQVHGTAMGKKFAPAYANIYMAGWEQTVFPKCPKLPLIYLRYLDDIFGIWSHSKSDFMEFISILNSHHSTITVKFDLQLEKLAFLDTQVFLVKNQTEEWELGTRVFFKPTDTHALLHKDSYHPRHTFRGIVKSQLIRFNRICTRVEDAERATRTLFKVLRTRGYSRSFLRLIKAETQGTQDKRVALENKGEGKIIPLITTFSATSLRLNMLIKTNFTRLQNGVEQLMNFKIISAFRRNKNLNDLLVHASLKDSNITTNNSGHFRPIKYIYNRYSDEGFPVYHQLNLKTKNLVYVIECDVCHKLYVGQTQNELSKRLKQHLYCIGREENKELYIHFRNHYVSNLLISGLETRENWSEGQRLAAERRWIQRLKTCLPHGLNEV